MTTIFSDNTIASIKNKFNEWKEEIHTEEDYFLIENSQIDLTKVVAIFQNLPYVPLLSFNQIKERYAFTLIPYELPPSFHRVDIVRSIDEVWGVIRAQATLPRKIAHIKPNPEVSSLIKQFVANYPKPGIALDLGCGFGADTLYLLKHQWTVTAVDCDVLAIQSLNETASEYVKAGKLRIKKEKIERLELNEKYDLVVAYSVLSYIEPELFPSVWIKIHQWVKGYFIGNLCSESPIISREECLGRGLWCLRDIHDLTALLRFMKYEIVSCCHSDGMPITLQLDFTAKI